MDIIYRKKRNFFHGGEKNYALLFLFLVLSMKKLLDGYKFNNLYLSIFIIKLIKFKK